MIKLIHKNKEYSIKKEKIIFILSKITNRKINENEIEKLMKKYHLFDKYFLENIE
ncbi:MAG: hypothetical protein IKL52_00260 [Candidatus Gastranaerophilales bacterium]|nr:hypothetical protein [Candidatus Gastranaerophilales bacterium]